MTVRLAQVGTGGYAAHYLNEALYNNADSEVLLAGVIDPFVAHSPHYAEIQKRQIPIYNDLEAFFAVDHADLVAIASPIHLHAPQTLTALNQGAHVLCEKPVCAVIQDAYRMAEAAQDRFVAIGYQWSFSQAIQDLKADIMRGDLGAAVRLKCRVYWPRPAAYYHRNTWAARIQLDDGTWVLDSPVNNAVAHYLHNMLYVLGPTRTASAGVTQVQAELYRANPIENYDTAAVRIHTDQNVEILFYTTHACRNNINPIFHYEFEKAVVTYAGDEDDNITATFRDGRTKNYGNPNHNRMEPFWQCVDAVQTGAEPACTVETAMIHTRCANGIQESVAHITSFPDTITHTIDTLHWVEALEDLLTLCYDNHLLPAETGQADWAQAGNWVDLRNYTQFPSNVFAR
jgi:predicted dehydrogenase